MAASYCYATCDGLTAVTDAYGSVEASVVSAGFVGHENESSLSYSNKAPAEPAFNCQLEFT